MEKLVRVANFQRGKKLIKSTNNYSDFVLSVRNKFDLDPAAVLHLEDSEGAQVDEDVFPVLWDQVEIPNLKFLLEGEVEQSVEINNGIASETSVIYVTNSSQPQNSGSSASFGLTFSTEVEHFRQILEQLLQADAYVSQLASECARRNCVDDKAATILIKEFVGKLIELKGQSPSTNDQKNLAKAIVEVIPCWKYSKSADGIDILYDEINRSGLIQARLRSVHKNLKEFLPVKTTRRTRPNLVGGPQGKLFKTETLPPQEVNEELIAQLNATSAANEEEELKSLVLQTLSHRNYLRQVGDNSILKIYPKFAEWASMVKFEFSLLHPEEEFNFVRLWPEIVPKVLDQAKTISNSPVLKKFLAEDCGNWDPAIAALFVVLHLIQPAAQGKGKGKRCNIEDAKNKIVSYFRTSTPLQSILDTWKSDLSQPNLVCLGETRRNLSNFFVVCDKTLVPTGATTSTEALDVLFKAHYVFGTEYDVNLSGFWKFVQVYVYKLDQDTTVLPMKVKKVFNQLQLCFDTV